MTRIPNRQGRGFLYEHVFGLVRNCFTIANAFVWWGNSYFGDGREAETDYMGKLQQYVTIKNAAEYLGVCQNTSGISGA